ncbi:MAG: hypothetical protein MJ137_02390 [Clostridia bacterium]|nr:hypothetical protein [Clostridia bacterium]
MKHILLPERGDSFGYYKANLHCHSTLSDGHKTPEELKKDYMSKGYSVICYTDHELFIPHPELCEESFIALNGVELGVAATSADSGESKKVCHICLVAKDRNNILQPCFHRSLKYVGSKYRMNADKITVDESKPDFERDYSKSSVNAMIKEARKSGFFVTYNHPVWSEEGYTQFGEYEGMDAIEMSNYSCMVEGYDETASHCYEDLLRQGKKVYCICTDDNHNAHPDGHPLSDSYGGYTMIGAPFLGYEEITASLEGGLFYSVACDGDSSGPDFLSVFIDDDAENDRGERITKVYVKTSAVRSIDYCPCTRSNKRAAAFRGESITEASFTVRPDEKWFRLVLTDDRGYKAYTNAFYLK